MPNLIRSKQPERRPEEKMERNKSLISEAYSYKSCWYDRNKDKKINLRKTAGLDLRGYQEIEQDIHFRWWVSK